MSSKVYVTRRLPMIAYELRALVAAIITTIINVIVYYIGDAAGAFSDTIEIMQGKSLQVSNVIMMSIIGTVVVILIFAAVGSFRRFRIIALIAFIILIFTPMTVKNSTALFIVFLELMHVTATAVVLWIASWKRRPLKLTSRKSNMQY